MQGDCYIYTRNNVGPLFRVSQVMGSHDELRQKNSTVLVCGKVRNKKTLNSRTDTGRRGCHFVPKRCRFTASKCITQIGMKIKC